MFTDKDGKTKTGFAGRMENRISAPRLLKLTPLDSHLADINNKFRNAQFSWVGLLADIVDMYNEDLYTMPVKELSCGVIVVL
uniref:protein CYPRO4-like n=1 Tax=Fragaria vesca subsp. vesca TaxID=101020 RepID=UPI0005CB7EC2|nr:PREDICTED: protein CYPRO4-like [Fragaria vesca subsp. vesca]